MLSVLVNRALHLTHMRCNIFMSVGSVGNFLLPTTSGVFRDRPHGPAVAVKGDIVLCKKL